MCNCQNSLNDLANENTGGSTYVPDGSLDTPKDPNQAGFFGKDMSEWLLYGVIAFAGWFAGANFGKGK